MDMLQPAKVVNVKFFDEDLHSKFKAHCAGQKMAMQDRIIALIEADIRNG
jgi:hypothetical protein